MCVECYIFGEKRKGTTWTHTGCAGGATEVACGVIGRPPSATGGAALIPGVVGRMGDGGGPGVKGRRLLNEGETKLVMEAMGEVGYCVEVADRGREANRLVVAGYGGAGAVLGLDNVASRDEGKACLRTAEEEEKRMNDRIWGVTNMTRSDMANGASPLSPNDGM